MPTDHLVVLLIAGLLAGFIASHLISGHGFGLVADLVVGVVGALIGWWLFTNIVHVAIGDGGFLTILIYGIIGAVLLLLVLRLVGAGRGRGYYGRRRYL
jgi:uncharacterized membrane protein YeaQ/YmgE (transglycosylase-associated protein family)